MTQDNTPRRGRPARARPPAARREPLHEATEEAPVPAIKRVRGPKIGVTALKLQAPERPGFTRRFAIANPDRIAEMERLGYSKVTDPSIASTGLGSGTVQRPAGTGENGDRYNHILMETPDELYADGVAEGERHRRSFEGDIRAGRDPQGRLPPEDQRDGKGSITVER